MAYFYGPSYVSNWNWKYLPASQKAITIIIWQPITSSDIGR